MKLYIHLPNHPETYIPTEQETLVEMQNNLIKQYGTLELLYCNRSIVNNTMLVSSLFNDLDDVQVKVLNTSQPIIQQQQQQKQVNIHYYPITKYTFYELDDMNVRVIVELKDISKLPKENIVSRFFERSFELKIHDYQGKNWTFGIGRTQCKLDPEGSRFFTKNDKLLITIRKVKKDDNWFSIYKQKTIGGADSD